ncbi:MAG TPA: GNAT family N-acetyltransferase [Blastocatellia bacterium]|nr:GNAT family N-acetyltransferase [Blastocatellia bacterium]
MTTQSAPERKYPWTTEVNGLRMSFRLMRPEDKEAMLSFARSLPEEDLVFLSFDITKPEAVDQWARNIQSGRIKTLLVEVGGRLVGYGSLGHNELLWTRHLGEIQLLLGPELRGRGVGTLLASELFKLARARGLQKIVARMASEQRGAFRVLENLGFTAEAVLADYVIDRKGVTHDLIVMSYDVTGLTEE